jgi:rare lipoprotein A
MHTKNLPQKISAFIFLSGIVFSWSLGDANAQTVTDGATQEQTTQQVFTDIDTGSTHYVAIKYLKDKGFIKGYDDGSFRPLDEINRAEALKMVLASIRGVATKNPEEFSFKDVNPEDWFYGTIVDAWNNYLIRGYSDGLFHPEKSINTAESLKIILKQEGGTIPGTVTYKPYTDVNIDDWFAPYAQMAKERSIILEERFSGNLNPGDTVNRGNLAEYLYRTIRSREGSSFARATWYADLLANQSTASGEAYVPDHFTVAHKTLTFGTKLLVTNLANGKSVEVTVNDRGPYVTGVDLDLSKSAFAAIASTGAGVINTEFQIISSSQNSSSDTITYGF